MQRTAVRFRFRFWDLTGKEYDMRHMTKFGSRGIQSDFSLARAAEIAVSGMGNITSSLRNAGGSLFWYNLQTYVKDEDFWNRMNACIADNQNGTVYISLDGDHVSDTLGLETYLIRGALINGLRLYDTAGNLVADGSSGNFTYKNLENGRTTLTSGGNQAGVSAEVLPDYHIKLTWDDGTVEELTYITGIYNTFKFYANPELQKLAPDYYIYAGQLAGKYQKADSAELSVNPDATDKSKKYML